MSATALIGRRPCGCVAAMDCDPTAEHRAVMESFGYTVTEHPISEAQELWETPRNDCGHGNTQDHLAANVKELTAMLELWTLLSAKTEDGANMALYADALGTQRSLAAESRALIARVKGTPC